MANPVVFPEHSSSYKQHVFALHASLSPASTNTDLRRTTDGTLETDWELDLSSVANTAYEASAKADLGALRAPMYKVRAALEFQVAPTAGNACYFFWGPSNSSTAAKANPGNLSGSTGAWTGYNSDAADVVSQLEFIGAMILGNTTNVQIGEVGILVPPERYGILVVLNESGQTMVADGVEMHVVLDPIYPEIQ